MKVLLTSSQAPFIRGGGELHAEALYSALLRAGHEVERVQLPFKFSPESDIERLMAFCDGYDLGSPNGQHVDRVISLQFPGWGMAHPNHVVWVMHQHRAAYELYQERTASAGLKRLRPLVHAYDTQSLSRARSLWANSARVAQRLKEFNGLDAKVLYHPPPGADALRCDEEWGYVFYPSRLESLKRQDLLIEAAALLRCPLKILIGGDGGQRQRYQELIEKRGVQDKVRLLGTFSDAEKQVLYAHSLGVVFVPFDEDLGYITLEAMFAAKPVLTCTDSGGPLEFVRDGETGCVLPPEPQALANALEALWNNKPKAARMGQAGRERVQALNLNWDSVVHQLCA